MAKNIIIINTYTSEMCPPGIACAQRRLLYTYIICARVYVREKEGARKRAKEIGGEL